MLTQDGAIKLLDERTRYEQSTAFNGIGNILAGLKNGTIVIDERRSDEIWKIQRLASELADAVVLFT